MFLLYNIKKHASRGGKKVGEWNHNKGEKTTVEPIRDKKKIQIMKTYLLGKRQRDYLLFVLGLNTGLRISDLLELKYSNIFMDKGIFREHLTIVEEKTNKTKKIKLNDVTRKCLKEYVFTHSISGDDYLFASKKGGRITRVQAYRLLTEAARAVGIEDFGTHSLRKTWGYWTYRASKYNIGLIMDMFNHSSPAVTLRYIGINQDQKDELYSIVQL